VYPPSSHRRTPTKLVGGGKGNTLVAPLEGIERSSGWGPEDSNVPLLSAPSLTPSFSLIFSLSLSLSLSLSIYLSIYLFLPLSPSSSYRVNLAYFLPSPFPDSLPRTFPSGSFSFSRHLSAFERRIHLYSAPTLLLAILLHANAFRKRRTVQSLLES